MEFLKQLKCVLNKVCKSNENTSNEIKNKMLPLLLHKDLSYHCVKHMYSELYSSLPSQAAQYISRTEIDAAYISYFEGRKSNKKAKLPYYKGKDDYHPLCWAKTTFSFIEKNKKGFGYIRLSLGNNSKISYEETINEDNLKNSKYKVNLVKGKLKSSINRKCKITKSMKDQSIKQLFFLVISVLRSKTVIKSYSVKDYNKLK